MPCPDPCSTSAPPCSARTADRRSRRRRTRACSSAGSRSSTHGASRTWSPAARSCRRRGNGPCVTAQWVIGGDARARRRPAACCCSTARPSARPTGTPLLTVVDADAGDRELSDADVSVPFRRRRRGRTAQATAHDDHVRDLIEQLLFTAPGERVNRPDFGCGLLQLVFAPNSPELAAAAAVPGPGRAAAVARRR